jgi:hypothetical protein
MVEVAAEGKSHGSVVLNQAQINTLQSQLAASNNNSKLDVWAKDIRLKNKLTTLGHLLVASDGIPDDQGIITDHFGVLIPFWLLPTLMITITFL